MAGTTIGNVIADFNTTLNLKVAVGATTATLDSATDDDGVALPTGTYFLTLDGGSISSKEYIKCTLTGTALTAIQSVSRQGALTTGFARTHRKGAIVTITDFASIRKMADLLDGTTSNADMTFTDLSFTGTTTAGLKVKTLTTTQRNAITPANGQIVYDSDIGENYQYIAGSWSPVSSGSTQPNASATVAGKVEIATSAESIAGTDTGGTGALLSVLPSDIKTNLFTATQAQASVYGADAGGDDTYVVAVVPVLAAYTTGQELRFKPTTANTGACTIDFGPGVKNIKLQDGTDPLDGNIGASQVHTLIYDGTNMVLQNPVNIVPFYFGDGSDGNVTISSNTTLTSDMYYNNLTINSTFTLFTAGYRVFVRRTLTNNGTISNNGTSAAETSNGAAGGAGLTGTLRGGGAGGAGGNGSGNCGGGGGGGGGVVWISAYNIAVEGTITATGGNGSAGYNPGGSSGTANGTAGGSVTKTLIQSGSGGAGGQGGSGGGAAGGTISSSVTNSKNLALMLTFIDSLTGTGNGGGGGGGGGGTQSGGGANGGGGGGQGGVIFELYHILTTSGTKTVTGGTGGAATGSGVAGTAGSAGLAIAVQI